MARLDAGPAAVAPPPLRLQMDDVLASRRRLWVRGRLVGLPAADASWWRRWRKRPADELPTVRLETRVSGHELTVEFPLPRDGVLDLTHDAGLTPTKRGWRVARHALTLGGERAEHCSVAVGPPDAADGAAVVVLPTAYTFEPDGARRLAADGAAVAAKIRRLARGPHGPRPVFYLGAVPLVGDARPVELALAAGNCGWPDGTFVLIPSNPEAVGGAVAAALDRLRWLFAGELELSALNLEPAFAAELASSGENQTDRAAVVWADSLEETPAPTSSAATVGGLRPVRSGLVPRHPVVFCHGLLAFSALRMSLPAEVNYFVPLREFLRDRGVRALFPRVAPTGGVAERARQLADQIRAATDGPVNLVAHSMGGLDARHLVTHLGFAGRAASLTTVATPHRGTFLADWLYANFRQRLPLFTAFDALGVNLAGFGDCRREVCAAFNARTPDADGVRYFSYCAEVSHARVTPYLRRAWNLLTPVEGVNDGMVSVESARWGECLGVLPADHFAQTPDAVHLRPGETFDALGFYGRLVENLARRGF